MRDEADRREFPARYRRCEQVKAISVVFRPNANTVCQRLGRGACIATLSIKGIPEVSFWEEGEVRYDERETFAIRWIYKFVRDFRSCVVEYEELE